MGNCKGSAGLVEHLKMLSQRTGPNQRDVVNEMNSAQEQQFCALFTYIGVN